jgi:uncharacterized membrane protein
MGQDTLDVASIVIATYPLKRAMEAVQDRTQVGAVVTFS